MAEGENNVELKRKADENPEEGDAEEDEWVGPMPSEATKAKKRKGGLSGDYLPSFRQSNVAIPANSSNANSC